MADIIVTTADLAAFSADTDQRFTNVTIQLQNLNTKINQALQSQTIAAFPDEEAQIRTKVFSAFQEEFASLLADINKLKSDVAKFSSDSLTVITRHSELGGLDADDHSQYHNDTRALTWLGTRDTFDLTEGAINTYYTDDRARDAVGAMLTDSQTVGFTYDSTSNTITASASGVAGNPSFTNLTVTNSGVINALQVGPVLPGATTGRLQVFQSGGGAVIPAVSIFSQGLTSGDYSLMQFGRASVDWGIATTAATSQFTPFSNVADAVFFTYAVGGSFRFVPSVNSTATLTISKGKVGINTPRPLNSLDIAGSGVVIGGGYAGIVAAPSGSLYVEGQMIIGSSVSTTSKLRVVQPGGVGIVPALDILSGGTTAADYTLVQFGRTGGEWGMVTSSAASQFATGSVAGDAVFFTYGATNAFHLTPSINTVPTLTVKATHIGINSTSPVNSLDISGSGVIGRSYAGVIAAPQDSLIIQGRLAVGAPTVAASTTITGLGNNSFGLGSYSASTSGYTGMQLGRTQAETTWALVASSNQFLTGTVSGDTVFRTESAAANMFFGNGTSLAGAALVGNKMSIGGAIIPSGSLHVIGNSYLSDLTTIGAESDRGTINLAINGLVTTGAGIAVANNCPVSGNPATWLEVMVNGTLRYMPCW